MHVVLAVPIFCSEFRTRVRNSGQVPPPSLLELVEFAELFAPPNQARLLQASSPVELPYRFGRYTLVEKIANGGTAEVYRAILAGDEGFAKTVAVKRLLPNWGGSEKMQRMLIDEARALVFLQHQAIVQVFELGRFDGAPFLAMEYVDGIDCQRLLAEIVRDRTPLSLLHAIYIIGQVLYALEFAHSATDASGRHMGIVHRDVSPSNILFSWNGEVKVTDFGIAKGIHRTHETEAGELRGKYSYMAPEQARGLKTDARTDIFACGIVFYELLTARRLFDALTDVGVLDQVRSVIIPEEGVRVLPAEIRAILMRALAPVPSERYQHASEMFIDLRKFAHSSGATGSSLEFADFLREKFAHLRCERKNLNSMLFVGARVKTEVMTHGGGCPAGKGGRTGFLRASGILFMLSLTAFIPHMNTAGSTQISAPPKGAALTAPAARVDENLPVRGAVAIDSRPSGAKGRLVIGDVARDIRTPFSLDGIDFGERVAGSVELSAPGHQTESVQFELTSQNPVFVKSVGLKKEGRASISVQARPWGIVDIPGHVFGRETPVNGIKVKPGTYSVSVRHPPTGSVAASRVELSDGKSIHCVAAFGTKPALRCQ